MASTKRLTRTLVLDTLQSSLPSGACWMVCTFKTESCLGVSREVAPGSQKQERILDGTNSQRERKRRTLARGALNLPVGWSPFMGVRLYLAPYRRAGGNGSLLAGTKRFWRVDALSPSSD